MCESRLNRYVKEAKRGIPKDLHEFSARENLSSILSGKAEVTPREETCFGYETLSEDPWSVGVPTLRDTSVGRETVQFSLPHSQRDTFSSLGMGGPQRPLSFTAPSLFTSSAPCLTLLMEDPPLPPDPDSPESPLEVFEQEAATQQQRPAPTAQASLLQSGVFLFARPDKTKLCPPRSSRRQSVTSSDLTPLA